MGKKDKAKKGKGAEKTSKKTQHKLEKKIMKAEKDSEECSIEQLIEEFQAEQKKMTDVTLSSSEPPSPRSHFSLTPCSESNELVLFGGEYYDGKKTTMFPDLFIYHCKEDKWTIVKSPTTPPPRSGHQAVYGRIQGMPACVWLFGGEYISPTQVRFHHYKDLWCLNVKSRKWTQVRVEGSGGPAARSGHRMLFWKKSLLLFGGFSDTGRKTIYFNDLWQFDLSTNRWCQIKLTGDVPSARSGCLFFPGTDMKSVYICGGYQKEYIGRDMERGLVCSDLFSISIEKDGSKATCTSLRLSGVRPKPPRSAMAGVLHTANRALVFGGVHDVEHEDGETVVGHFHNEMFSVELDKGRWHEFHYALLKESTTEDAPIPVAPLESQLSTPTSTGSHLIDGVFQLKLEGAVQKPVNTAIISKPQTRLLPPPRSNAGLIVVGSVVYLYGGVYEVGDRKITLDDFYSLDLSHPVSWRCLNPGTQENQEWFGSDLEDEDEETSEEEDEKHPSGDHPMEVCSESSSEDDDDDEALVEDAPLPQVDETQLGYWTRTTSFWCDLIRRGLETSDQAGSSSSTIESMAKRLASDFFKQHSKQ